MSEAFHDCQKIWVHFGILKKQTRSASFVRLVTRWLVDRGRAGGRVDGKRSLSEELKSCFHQISLANLLIRLVCELWGFKERVPAFEEWKIWGNQTFISSQLKEKRGRMRKKVWRVIMKTMTNSTDTCGAFATWEVSDENDINKGSRRSLYTSTQLS